MKINFSKYQGTGNDFIIIDNMNGQIENFNTEIIQKLCIRSFGIGSDGLILLNKTNEADYWMDFYNPDGSQSLCGNGSRCAFLFANKLGYVGKSATFKAFDGNHEAKFIGDNIGIHMNDISSAEKIGADYFINTGSPHYVQYLANLDSLNIIEKAHAIRYNSRFENLGTNVNFVKEDKDGIKMRTYERGVENETLSCGTGVTAAALSFGLKNKNCTHVKVNTKGGKLEVSFTPTSNGFKDIWLIGPAQHVFDGIIKV